MAVWNHKVKGILCFSPQILQDERNITRDK